MKHEMVQNQLENFSSRWAYLLSKRIKIKEKIATEMLDSGQLNPAAWEMTTPFYFNRKQKIWLIKKRVQ